MQGGIKTSEESVSIYADERVEIPTQQMNGYDEFRKKLNRNIQMQGSTKESEADVY